MSDSDQKRVLSGIQPSGLIHIGNYFGAIKNWIELLDDYECFFAIVDLHVITADYDPDELQQRIMDAAIANIACGLDPEKCTLFVQSHVPEHALLQWLLNSVASVGELQRQHQYKQKKEQQSHTEVSAGLMNYPILQAADIALYHADLVPVGEDQRQHIEFTRDVLRRFNNRFGDYFTEPEELINETGARIMGLDAENKMSKSLDNYIGVLEDPDTIRERIVSEGVTDPNRKRLDDPGNPEICNIYSWHKLFSDEETIERVGKECRAAEIGCVDDKKLIADNIIDYFEPMRERARELREDTDQVRDILHEGAKKARTIAQDTLDHVMDLMGLKPDDLPPVEYFSSS
jgi:tryptophanyl-tRNA synthetase